MDEEGLSANYIAGTPYVGMNVKMYAGPGGNRGEFQAWNPHHGQGGVVDQGRSAGVERHGRDRRRRRVLRHDGRLVQGRRRAHRQRCSGSSRPAPESSASRSRIAGPDGHQYVAVLSGVGGWPGAIVAGGLDARDSSAALGFVNAMQRPAVEDDEGRHALRVRPMMTRARQATRRGLAMRGDRAARASLCVATWRGAARTRAAPLEYAPIRTTCPSRIAAREGFENRIADARRRASCTTGRVHLVGAAARLRAQHAERRRVRPRHRHARRAWRCSRRRGRTTGRRTSSSRGATGSSTFARSTIRGSSTLQDRRAAHRRRLREHAAGARAGEPRHRRRTSSAFTVYGDYAQAESRRRASSTPSRRATSTSRSCGVRSPDTSRKRSRVPLDVVPVTPASRSAVSAVRVRHRDGRAARRLDVPRSSSTTIIVRRKPTIDSILAAYGVPLVDVATDSSASDVDAVGDVMRHAIIASALRCRRARRRASARTRLNSQQPPAPQQIVTQVPLQPGPNVDRRHGGRAVRRQRVRHDRRPDAVRADELQRLPRATAAAAWARR